MNLEKQIRKQNERLGQALGYINGYLPSYKWVWSEDMAMMHPMRVRDGSEFGGVKRDYKANDAGIIEAVPIYALRKMCPAANQQWVLAHWLPSPSESEWRNLFGYMLEWPKDGQYYPTNVFLDPGQLPEDAITDAVVSCVRQERSKTPRQVEQDMVAATEKREREAKDRQYEAIRDACTTYDHVPGRCDQVSYPAIEQAEEGPAYEEVITQVS